LFLGHEGTGSVLSSLKDKGFAMSLSTGLVDDIENYSLFECNIVLTGM